VRDWMLWKECPRAQGSRGLGFRRSHNLRLTVGRRDWRSEQTNSRQALRRHDDVGAACIEGFIDRGALFSLSRRFPDTFVRPCSLDVPRGPSRGANSQRVGEKILISTIKSLQPSHTIRRMSAGC